MAQNKQVLITCGRALCFPNYRNRYPKKLFIRLLLQVMKKKLFIIIAMLCIVIGSIGIFIPLLPTTPFLLLAASLFLKSSQKHYNRLVNNRIYGVYIRNYIERRGIPLRIKIFTITILWVGIILSILFATTILWLRLLLFIIAIAVTLHIVFIKSAKDSKKSLNDK